MLTLKCDCCGWEQHIKKRIDDEDYRIIKESRRMFCDRKACRDNHPSAENGYVMSYGVVADWKFEQLMTLNDYRAIKRAEVLLNYIDET